MRKKTRLEKAWGRNQALYMCKAVYMLVDMSIREMPTPKQFTKQLLKYGDLYRPPTYKKLRKNAKKI